MRFLADERLYSRTGDCLRFLRGLGGHSDETAARAPERYHLYWRGPFSLKQAFAVKSFLATQDLESSELWLWLDGEHGYDGHEENPLLGPLLPFLRVRRFDPEVEARDTPVERRPDLHEGVGPAARSDFFRHLVLYRYGGLYADMDIMFLRDMRPLLRDPSFPDEFCYRWSAHQPHGNSAVMRLRQASDTGRALLARCAERGRCHPRFVLRFDEHPALDLLILPCPFFDPLWAHHDRQDRYGAAPFDRFADFFRKFDWRFRRKRAIRSHRDFFPGAFTYHWHNYWDAPERADSYFGLFDRELDGILQRRLGVAADQAGTSDGASSLADRRAG
jgi:hypothetical protein